MNFQMGNTGCLLRRTFGGAKMEFQNSQAKEIDFRLGNTGSPSVDVLMGNFLWYDNGFLGIKC